MEIQLLRVAKFFVTDATELARGWRLRLLVSSGLL
jgi:hypothetical protein